MLTFEDSKYLAKQKVVNNMFGQSTNFKLPAEAEAGNAEKQPRYSVAGSARNMLTGENKKAVAQHPTALPNKSFLS